MTKCRDCNIDQWLTEQYIFEDGKQMVKRTCLNGHTIKTLVPGAKPISMQDYIKMIQRYGQG